MNQAVLRLVISFLLAAFCFAWDWGGYRGKLMPWGDPRLLSDIWWHFPLYFVGCGLFVEVFRRRTPR